jgi:putative ABC transport system permease protein
MNLFKIAWRNMTQRGLSSVLTLISLSLGVALTVLVLSVYGIIEDAFRRNSSVGYNLIVGAKGSALQLTLNTVYYLSKPIETIPYSEYLEYLPQQQRQFQARQFDGQDEVDTERDGKFAPYMMGGFAIPVALGDYFGEYRVVGTTPEFFNLLRHGPDLDQEFTFAAGENFVTDDPRHGPYTAVVGAQVAREMNVGLGDGIDPSHGDPDGHGHGIEFVIVGVLDPTGTPNDRAAFVNLEGFFLMDGHARAIDPDAETGDDTVASSDAEAPAETDSSAVGSSSLSYEPLPIRRRDLTAILLRTDGMMAARMQKTINKQLRTQAAAPVGEITGLLDIIVAPLMQALLLITMITCVVAAVGILVSIYNSMNDRKRDIAVMRALGARRDTVLTIILLESLLIAVGGAIIGWLLAHLAVYAAGGMIEQRTGVQVGLLTVSQTELWVIPLVLGLAALAGLLPALVGYRTDVAKNLNP